MFSHPGRLRPRARIHATLQNTFLDIRHINCRKFKNYLNKSEEYCTFDTGRPVKSRLTSTSGHPSGTWGLTVSGQAGPNRLPVDRVTTAPIVGGVGGGEHITAVIIQMYVSKVNLSFSIFNVIHPQLTGHALPPAFGGQFPI